MISDRPWVCLANMHVRVSFFFTLTASSHARDDIDNEQDRAFVDPFVTPVDKKAEAPSQEINYSADFDAGWQLLIHGPTTILPGKPTIAGRRRGSLKVKPSKHGKRRDPCCGSTANVSVFSSSIPLMCVDDISAGSGKSVLWYAWLALVLFWRYSFHRSAQKLSKMFTTHVKLDWLRLRSSTLTSGMPRSRTHAACCLPF